MTFYNSRTEAIDNEIRKPLADAANRDKITETMIENIAHRLIRPVVQPDPRGAFVVRGEYTHHVSPQLLRRMVAAYGPDTRQGCWMIFDGGTNLDETRQFFVIHEPFNPQDDPVDVIETVVGQNSTSSREDLAAAGWEFVDGAEGFPLPSRVQRIEVA